MIQPMHLDSLNSDTYMHTYTQVKVCERNFAQRFCACVIVELEHEYSYKECECTYKQTALQTDRQYPHAPHHVGLAQARPYYYKPVICILPYYTVYRASKYGIYTLLDAHQVVLSEKFCGEGTPDWAVDSGCKAFSLYIHVATHHSQLQTGFSHQVVISFLLRPPTPSHTYCIVV